MMKTAVRQQRHRLKENFFDPFPLHLVMRTSPMNPPTSDDEWLRLVEAWKKLEKWYKKQLLPFTSYFGTCLTFVLYMM
jgi:hypothetical protein